MSNFSANGSTVSVVTTGAMTQEKKLKDNTNDVRLSELGVSQTELIKAQYEDGSLAAARAAVTSGPSEHRRFGNYLRCEGMLMRKYVPRTQGKSVTYQVVLPVECD